jgi:hypothetical protein
MNKTKKPRLKKYTLVLSEPEMRRLTRYAEQEGVDRPVALHRIVSQTLRQVPLSPVDRRDENQLGLFDSLQIDIFNNTQAIKQ